MLLGWIVVLRFKVVGHAQTLSWAVKMLSLMIVAAPRLAVVAVGGETVFTAGTVVRLVCTFTNSSLTRVTTPPPWRRPPPRTRLPGPGPLAWTRDNATFSTRNRKR